MLVFPHPASGIWLRRPPYIELFSNWDQVMWAGADGEVSEFKARAAYRPGCRGCAIGAEPPKPINAIRPGYQPFQNCE